MSQELLYTSAPRGLKPGSRGFCTVLSTQGMPAPLAAAVEALSGYRPVYPTSDERAARNPVVYSHLKMQATGRTWHVLSRIADYGLDYSQRANKLAHHVILDNPSERLSGGPANLLSMPGFMREEWEGEPKVVALKPVTREPHGPSGVCRHWQELTGDAGWAGVLAESFLRDPERLVILLFAPGQEILPLFVEALSLLPPEKRWDVTFSTYFTGLATGTTCLWRAMVHDSKEAHESLRFVSALRIDLTADSLGPATGGELVEAARSGERTSYQSTRVSPPTVHKKNVNGGSKSSDEGFENDKSESTHFDGGIKGLPQKPPQMATGRDAIPIAGTPSKQRSGRRLADVIEEESRRPPSRRWLWIAFVAAGLMMATTVGVGIRHYQSGACPNAPSKSKPKALDIVHNHAAPTKPPSKTEQPSGQSQQTPPPVEMKPNDKPNTGYSVAHTANNSDRPTGDSPSGVEIPVVTETNNSQNSLSQIKKEQPEPTLCKLPKKDQPSIELYEFPLPKGQPQPKTDTAPSMRLFKPSWLPYFDGPTTIKGQVSERDINIIATGAVPVARFITTVSDNSKVAYKLKSLNDEHVKWIGWYRIQVVPATSKGPALKEIKFADFPLKNESLERKFNNNTLSWPLPLSAAVDTSHMPQLTLGNLVVRIGTKDYQLELHDSAPGYLWQIGCKKFESEIYTEFKKQPDNKPKLSLKLEIVAKENFPTLDLKITGKDQCIKPIKEGLGNELQSVKSKLLAACDEADSKSVKIDEGTARQLLEEKLKKISVDGQPSENSVGEVVTSLGKVLSAVMAKGQESANNKESGFTTVESGLNTAKTEFQSVCDKILKYSAVKKSLDDVRLQAIRIYYEVVDTERKAVNSLGKITVDVVNFDDTKQSAEAKP